MIIIRFIYTNCADFRDVIEFLLIKLNGQVHCTTTAVADIVVKLQPVLLTCLEAAD